MAIPQWEDEKLQMIVLQVKVNSHHPDSRIIIPRENVMDTPHHQTLHYSLDYFEVNHEES